jgi:hypothetical protein
MSGTFATAGYRAELAGLPDAIGAASGLPSESELAVGRDFVSDRVAFVVASGGAAPVAHFAARLHSQRTGRPASALTPLAYLGEPVPYEPTCVILLSATARHPDTAMAVRAALQREQPVLVVTQRSRDELRGVMADSRTTLLTIPQPGGRDGFLATRSLIISAIAMARLYDAGPLDLAAITARALSPSPQAVLRERVVVLHAYDERPAAVDIESRLSEAGIAAVQVADYRTLAHGRHYGISRSFGDTSVIALISPSSAVLAERTLNLLPSSLPVLRLVTTLTGSSAVLDLLVQSMHLPVATADEAGVVLHKPGVPVFGRRLYHLRPPAPMVARVTPSAVSRKMRAAGMTPDSDSHLFQAALIEWAELLQVQQLGALALDYDGTVVATRDRYETPRLDVQANLISILASGLAISFASGRGDSLHRDLRAWVPRKYWPRIHLGLHNGAWRLNLVDEADEPDPDPALDEVMKRLAPYEGVLWRSRRSPTQVTLIAADPLHPLKRVHDAALALVSAAPSCRVRITMSGHSVDVVPATAGKDLIVRDLARENGAVLAIGDRGDVYGNDFELLSSTRWSLTVDRCSAALDRCWGLAPRSVTGPDALIAQLSWLHGSRRGHRLRPPARVISG